MPSAGPTGANARGIKLFSSRESIRELVSLLEARQASLWHACQLVDFVSYLSLDGIPSRHRLEMSRVPFTPFVTDASDRRNALWDKVFLNLEDFGHSFARGGTATPNAYGPIAMQIRPDALLHATDVAVCLRSAGAAGFDREAESLDTTEDVDRIFRYPIDAGFPRSSSTRFGETLRAAFPGRACELTSCEVSCTISEGLAPIGATVVVWVDPIDVPGARLVDLVRDQAAAAELGTIVRERTMIAERRTVIQEVSDLLSVEQLPLRLVAGRHDLSAATRAWAAELVERGLGWQFERYSRYLVVGTLEPITAIARSKPIPEHGARTRHEYPASSLAPRNS